MLVASYFNLAAKENLTAEDIEIFKRMKPRICSHKCGFKTGLAGY